LPCVHGKNIPNFIKKETHFMHRRRFLQMAALTGLTVVAPTGDVRRLRAQQGYQGPLWVFVNAGGGWDPTSFCDPKGGTINRLYAPSDIQQAGKIPFAPATYSFDIGNQQTRAYSNQEFFSKFAPRLLVVNGIDTTTNNHDTGSRFIWSGKIEEGYPSFSALLAGSVAPNKPLAFLSNGGYDVTSGVVPLARAGSPDTIKRLAYPGRMDPNNEKSGYHSLATTQRIQDAQRARLEALAGAQTLPALQASANSLFLARASSNDLINIVNFLPPQKDIDAIGNDLAEQAMVAFAAYKAGIAVSVNLSIGGFDTHGDHDRNQLNALGRLLDGVDKLMTIADADPALANRVVVVMGSDFGRTPNYNDKNGKDHWPITSMMFLGAGISGNRVVGSTDSEFKAIGVDAGSLAPNPQGAKISPKSIHLAMRRLAGIADAPAAKQFAVAGDSLPIFG